MFDRVAEVDAERHTEEGVRTRARLGQRPGETVLSVSLGSLLLTPQGLHCCTGGLLPRALLVMICLPSELGALATAGNSQTQTNERASGTTKQD